MDNCTKHSSIKQIDKLLFDSGLLTWDEYYIFEELKQNSWDIIENPLEKEKILFKLLDKIENENVLFSSSEYILNSLNFPHICKLISLEIQNNENILDPIQKRIILGPDEVSIECIKILAKISTFYQLPLIDIQAIFSWLESYILNNPDDPKIITCCSVLHNILKSPEIRKLCLVHGRKLMRAVIIKLIISKNSQIQYDGLVLLWILSFDKDLCSYLQVSFSIISTLLDIAKSSNKEKNIRIILSIWCNFLKLMKNDIIPIMLGTKLLTYIEQLEAKKFTDEEMLSDIHTLSSELVTAFTSLNSFEEYYAEIKSGFLQWSPPHRSTLFWKDNVNKLLDNNAELLKILAINLTQSTDPKIISISCHDINQFIIHSPKMSPNIIEFGIKSSLMTLISHPDSDVRYQALGAMQTIMRKSWN